ncbi:hypothetical protein F5883DRAFT_579658, partial [Diaporthe sp. PMI_573]
VTYLYFSTTTWISVFGILSTQHAVHSTVSYHQVQFVQLSFLIFNFVLLKSVFCYNIGERTVTEAAVYKRTQRTTSLSTASPATQGYNPQPTSVFRALVPASL